MSNVYLASNGESTRVVFLIDVAMGRALDACERKTLGRAITLTSTKTLLCLSKFPQLRYKDVLKWNYTFYDSQQIDWSLRIRSGNFLELSSHQMESYSRDVFTRLDSSAMKCVKTTTQPGANLLYNAIGTAVQDYPWDAPFIISPVRPNRPTMKNSKRLSNVEKEQSNIIFIFNHCPSSRKDLQTFCGLKHAETDIDVDAIKSKLFTEDLRSSVMKKSVKIYFINCTGLAKQSKSKDLNGLLLYSEAVSKSIGGKVLELCQFISPVSHRALRQGYYSTLDCQNNLQSQQDELAIESLQECCHSSSVSERKKKSPSICTLTYPIQTALATVISREVTTTDSTSREQTLLELSEDGKYLCTLSVSPMLQDDSLLLHFGHSSSSPTSEQNGSPVKAEVIGIIRAVDINFTWLHPTKLYTCTGLRYGASEDDKSHYSKYFQTLNLWLAANKCVLTVKVNDTNECALFQPITSLVASFIFVKPECVMSLYALSCTSLAENKLYQTDSDLPCSSKHISNNNLFPMEADFCVNLDRLLFSASISSDCDKQYCEIVSAATTIERPQPFLISSFHPCSLCLPADNVLGDEFYAKLYQLAKTEESNYSNSLSAFQESLDATNQGCSTKDETAECHQQATTNIKSEVLSGTDLTAHFKSLYQQCVESEKNEEELFESLTKAIKRLENILTSDELLKFLDQSMLLNHSELRAKHEATQNATTEKKKINEYQLQALLYLEAHKRGLQDHVFVAEQLVLLLRGISLMADTQFLSRYLTEIILANYLDSCSDAIRLLYEELMLPLPVQLSSPTLDTSYATSDGESPFCSVSKPLVTASAVEDNSSNRKLKRLKSFHGFPAAKKQITVRVEKKGKKVTKGNRHDSKYNTTRSSFRSVKSPHNRIGGKNVRRNLFTRSKSMMAISNHSTTADSNTKRADSTDGFQEASHHGIKVDNIVCVQETPLKKQVSNYQQFKLQRTRSKLGKPSFPEVNSIEESPYRAVQWISGSNTNCSLQEDIVDGMRDEDEIVSSSSDEDPSKTPDVLMSFYLCPPTPTSQDVLPKDLQPLEAATATDSMVAFKLTTPPKEARLNFLNVTKLD